MIRLPSFSTNINGNEVCTKKINQILKKKFTLFFVDKNWVPCTTDNLFFNWKSFVWPNYYILEKLWKQK